MHSSKGVKGTKAAAEAMQPSRENRRYAGSPHGGGRGGPNKDHNSSSPSPSSSSAASAANTANAKGIYKNKAMHYSISMLLGTNVCIKTSSDKYYEGVLVTWSPSAEVVLEMVHEVLDPKDTSAPLDPELIKEKMVFPITTIVKLEAKEVDLGYAVQKKESFMTDAMIGSNGAASSPMGANRRDLEEWQPDDDSSFVELESGSNGWSAEDMFKSNERDHGVKSTYKDNLEGYTVQLSSERDCEKEARAASIAREIEGNTNSLHNVELENGDEEEAFSAVTRNPRRGCVDESGKYVPPAKRQNSKGDERRMQHSGPPPRTTPPPSGGYRGEHHEEYGRGRGGQGGDRGDRRSYDGNDRRSSGGGPSYGGGQPAQRGGYDSHHRGAGKPPQKDTAAAPPRMSQPPPAAGARPAAASPAGAAKSSQSEKIEDLKKFQENFNLSETEPAASDKKPAIPVVSAAPSSRQNSSEEPADKDAKAPSPVTASESAAATPATTIMKTSKLNPNAKEFSFNPNARAFVPGAPRTTGSTPPARPQTPATPTNIMPMGGQPPLYQPGMHAGIQMGQGGVMLPGGQQGHFIAPYGAGAGFPQVSAAQQQTVMAAVMQQQQAQQAQHQQAQQQHAQQQQAQQQQQQQHQHHPQHAQQQLQQQQQAQQQQQQQPRFRGNNGAIRPQSELPNVMHAAGQSIISIPNQQQVAAAQAAQALYQQAAFQQAHQLAQQQQSQSQQQQQQQQQAAAGGQMVMRMLPPGAAQHPAAALQQQQQPHYMNQQPPPVPQAAAGADGTTSGPPSMSWPAGVPPPAPGATPPAPAQTGGPPPQAPPPTTTPTPSPGPNMLGYLPSGAPGGLPHHVVVSSAGGAQQPHSLPPHFPQQSGAPANMMLMNPYYPAAMAGQPGLHQQQQGNPAAAMAALSQIQQHQQQHVLAQQQQHQQQQHQYIPQGHPMLAAQASPQPTPGVPPPHPGQPQQVPPSQQPPPAQVPQAGSQGQ